MGVTLICESVHMWVNPIIGFHTSVQDSQWFHIYTSSIFRNYYIILGSKWCSQLVCTVALRCQPSLHDEAHLHRNPRPFYHQVSSMRANGPIDCCSRDEYWAPTIICIDSNSFKAVSPGRNIYTFQFLTVSHLEAFYVLTQTLSTKSAGYILQHRSFLKWRKWGHMWVQIESFSP